MIRMLSIIFAALLLAFSARAQKITTDFDPAADFSWQRTYAWGEGIAAKNPAINQKIIAAVEAQLAAKGLTKAADANSADLLVAYQAATIMDMDVTTYTTGVWAPGYGTWPTSRGMAHTEVAQIRKGQLIVDIADVKTKKFLWRGIAGGSVSDDPEKVSKGLDKVLAKMFKDYPPRRKG